MQRGSEPPISLPTGFVQLIRPDDWWTAIYNAPGNAPYEIYIDISTPATWVDERTVECIDLDLDVVRRFTGPIELLDEDEFAEHAELFNYPEDVVQRTAATAQQLLRAVEARTEPFGSASHGWLAKLAELPAGD